MNFDWQSEDADWNEPPPTASGPTRRPLWRRALVPLALLLVLVAFAFFLSREARERVIEAEEQTTEDLLASVALVHQAANPAAGDGELLRVLLSGRDAAWAESQSALADAGRLFAGAAGALGMAPAAPERPPLQQRGRDGGTDAVQSVVLAPDLRSAQVTTVYSYSVQSADGQTQMVTLQQSALYRRGSNRWLLSPPLSDFWGERRHIQTQYLAVTYPERDEQVARRLARHLDLLLRELCSRYPTLDCADRLALTVELVEDPTSLLELDPLRWQSAASQRDAQRLLLPSPSLVGLPVDDSSGAATAYRALLRGYAPYVLRAAVERLTEYECCRHEPLFHALLEWQLAELDVIAWPLQLEDYTRLLDTMEGPAQLQALWESWERPAPAALAPEERRFARAVAELLAETGRVPDMVVRLQETLGADAPLAAWLRDSGSYASVLLMEESWRTLLRERVEQLQAAQNPPPAPEQDLLLACQDGRTSALFRFNPGSGEWQELMERQGVTILYPLAGDDGVLLTGRPHGGALGRTWLLRDEEPIVLTSGMVENILPFTVAGGRSRHYILTRQPLDDFFLPQGPVSDPRGEIASVWLYRDAGWPDSAGIVNLAQCVEGVCHPQPLPGLPVWSPDGAHFLLDTGRTLLLAGREGGGREVIDQGLSPFWVDEHRFGYIDRRGQTVLVRSPRDEAGTPLLTETAVAPLLAELDGWDRRWGRFERVLAGPQGSDRLALVATGDRRPGEVIFLYDRGMLSVLAQLTESRTYALHLSALFSPDARWLALPIASSGPRPSGPERLLLFDLTTGTQVLAPPTTPAPLDWSADGSWLAHWRGDGVLELIAPGWTGAGDQPYRIFALPPFRFEGHGACSGLAWVERE